MKVLCAPASLPANYLLLEPPPLGLRAGWLSTTGKDRQLGSLTPTTRGLLTRRLRES